MGYLRKPITSWKALNNLKAGLQKLGQTPYYARDMQVTLPAALFVPNSLLNRSVGEAIDMLEWRGWPIINEVVGNPWRSLRRFTRKRISAFR